MSYWFKLVVDFAKVQVGARARSKSGPVSIRPRRSAAPEECAALRVDA
jgi:hypothetical protein